jgi:hypothetical protein
VYSSLLEKSWSTSMKSSRLVLPPVICLWSVVSSVAVLREYSI